MAVYQESPQKLKPKKRKFRIHKIGKLPHAATLLISSFSHLTHRIARYDRYTMPRRKIRLDPYVDVITEQWHLGSAVETTCNLVQSMLSGVIRVSKGLASDILKLASLR